MTRTRARRGKMAQSIQVLPEDVYNRTLVTHVHPGVAILLGCNLRTVKNQGTEKLLSVEQDGVSRELRVDAILLGVGRAPNVEGLNLEAVGVEYDKKDGVKVNERLQTTNP